MEDASSKKSKNRRKKDKQKQKKLKQPKLENEQKQEEQNDTKEDQFEDQWEDEYDEEDAELMKQSAKEEVDQTMEGSKSEEVDYFMDMNEVSNILNKIGTDEVSDDEEPNDTEENKKIWKIGEDALGEGETLEYDSSAYEILRDLNLEWPCLSFAIFPDRLGQQRKRYPFTAYFIGGTQADESNNNKLILFKTSQLYRTNESEDSEDEDDDNEDEEPVIEFRTIPHPGAINRVKVQPQEPHVVATWSEDGKVYLWNVQQYMAALDKPPAGKLGPSTPIKKLTNHGTEGFALDWSAHRMALLSGDCHKCIYLTESHNNGVDWVQEQTPFAGHTKSVEDIQWSPTESTVFASCSADKTVRIWDTRMKKNAQISYEAAECDVNVISWNRKETYLLASGADDGTFKVWDLRNLQRSGKSEPIGHFKWHKDQITSIEWSPFEDTVLAVAGADDQITIWDLALEADKEGEEEGVPPQLLFIHGGQEEIKEVHWHAQIPGLLASTAANAFNIFKPTSSIFEETNVNAMEQ